MLALSMYYQIESEITANVQFKNIQMDTKSILPSQILFVLTPKLAKTHELRNRISKPMKLFNLNCLNWSMRPKFCSHCHASYGQLILAIVLIIISVSEAHMSEAGRINLSCFFFFFLTIIHLNVTCLGYGFSYKFCWNGIL